MGSKELTFEEIMSSFKTFFPSILSPPNHKHIKSVVYGVQVLGQDLKTSLRVAVEVDLECFVTMRSMVLLSMSLGQF